MDASELLWVEQQRINRAQIKREGRKVLNYFLLVLAATGLTVAAATYLALSVSPSRGAIMATPHGAEAPQVDDGRDAKS